MRGRRLTEPPSPRAAQIGTVSRASPVAARRPFHPTARLRTHVYRAGQGGQPVDKDPNRSRLLENCRFRLSRNCRFSTCPPRAGAQPNQPTLALSDHPCCSKPSCQPWRPLTTESKRLQSLASALSKFASWPVLDGRDVRRSARIRQRFRRLQQEPLISPCWCATTRAP